MFQTSIGPTGQVPGFMRPETAQGMFVNFRRLYDYNNGKMPMGVAQIGSAYRNEIAPRGGLLRVREFSMAEIEYFVHPEEKDHFKFSTVSQMRLNLFPKENQVCNFCFYTLLLFTLYSSMGGEIIMKAHFYLTHFQVGDGKTINPTLGEAVAKGIINNETLAYFLGRTAIFMHKVGIKPEGMFDFQVNFSISSIFTSLLVCKRRFCVLMFFSLFILIGLRFRQHLDTEMAHYASDCWDAEVLMASGWVECAGHADRSAYDLEVHSKATRTELVAKKSYPEPIMREVVVLKANKGLMGKQFRQENAAVQVCTVLAIL